MVVITASGQTSTLYTGALNESPTAHTCDASQSYAYGNAPQINSLSSDGTYSVCAKLSDDAGNVAYAKSQLVIRDIVAPTMTSFNAANEASDLVVTPAEASAANAFATLS